MNPTAKPPEITVADVAARGMAWLFGQTVVTKLVNLAGQVALACLLAVEDFGLVALAYLSGIIAGVLGQAGLREVLVRRHRRFNLWANPAFWMSVCFGLGGLAVMVLSAPLFAWIFDERQLLVMILILSVPVLVDRLSTVPLSLLQAQMRFRMVATIGLVGNVGQMVLTVVFAWLGCEAYSFIWSRLIMAVMLTAVYWTVARVPVRLDLQLRRWRYLICDTGLVFVSTLLSMAVQQGDYLVLGLMFSKGVVGLYFFAFNLSSQTAFFFLSNLGHILFPALSNIDDPQRQTAAFLRASRLTALVAMPLCCLQAALADPVFRVLFDPKWVGAIPLMQVLSLAMIGRMLGWQATHLIKARGRFDIFLKLMVVFTATFFALVILGAWWAGAFGVAVAAAVHFTISGLVNLYVAIRPTGAGWRDLYRVLVPPSAAAGLSVGAAAAAAELLPQVDGRDWLRIGVICLVSAVLGISLIWWFAGDDCRDLIERVRQASGNLGVGLSDRSKRHEDVSEVV